MLMLLATLCQSDACMYELMKYLLAIGKEATTRDTVQLTTDKLLAVLQCRRSEREPCDVADHLAFAY